MLVLMGGNAGVERTVDVFLLPLTVLLVDLIETRLLRRLIVLLIVVMMMLLLLLLRRSDRWCRLITRVMLRSSLAAYVGSGG